MKLIELLLDQSPRQNQESRLQNDPEKEISSKVCCASTVYCHP